VLTLIFGMWQRVCHCQFCLQMQPIPHLWMLAPNCNSDYPWCETKNFWCSVDTNFQNIIQSSSLIFRIIKAANTSKNDNDVPNSIFSNLQYDLWMWSKIENPKFQKWKLEPTSLAKSSNTSWLTGTAQCFTGQKAASPYFGQVWDETTVCL